MEHIWQKIAELRAQYAGLQEDQTPIDVFTFLEVDLGIDPIPFDDLTAKYRVEAAIKADFTGIYLDAEQYKLMEKGPDWKLNRLRFTVAHELAHYFLHRDLPQKENFASLPDFARWNETYGGQNTPSSRRQMSLRGGCWCPRRACWPASMNSHPMPKNYFPILRRAVRSGISLRKRSLPALG